MKSPLSLPDCCSKEEQQKTKPQKEPLPYGFPSWFLFSVQYGIFYSIEINIKPSWLY
jgi:hypothetical protein